MLKILKKDRLCGQKTQDGGYWITNGYFAIKKAAFISACKVKKITVPKEAKVFIDNNENCHFFNGDELKWYLPIDKLIEQSKNTKISALQITDFLYKTKDDTLCRVLNNVDKNILLENDYFELFTNFNCLFEVNEHNTVFVYKNDYVENEPPLLIGMVQSIPLDNEPLKSYFELYLENMAYTQNRIKELEAKDNQEMRVL